jgi:polyferredoxin
MKENVIVGDKSLLTGVLRDINQSKGYYDEELKKLDIKSRKQDISMRKEYAWLIFRFVCYYMFFVFLILFLSGSPSLFKMSDSVLITLLGTTTATVISLFAIVVNYLFPKK